MLTVMTVLWQGNFRKRKYSPEWVVRTKSMIDRNLTLPHKFVCLSNVHDIPGINIIPLKYDLVGWWSKLELFNPELSTNHPDILFVDLDNLINSSLDSITDYKDDLTLSPGSRKEKRLINKENTITYYKYSTQLMYICPGSDYIKNLWNRMNFSSCIGSYRGDQDYINSLVEDVKVFPSDWFTRTKYCNEKKPKEKIISGNPVKPDEAATKWNWAKEIWK